MAFPAAAGISMRYLGWKPTGDTPDDRVLEPALRDLLDKSRKWSNKLKKHWLEFSNGKLRITEFTATSSYRYREIPLADISSAKIDSVDPLAFGLVLLGYNEESTCSVNLHAWLAGSAAELSSFAARLTAAVHPKPSPDKYCLELQPLPHQQHQAAAAPAMALASLGSLAHSLAQELRQRLDSGSAAPLLHPPRDYDTLRRSHGNVRLRGSELQLATSSRAPNGAYIRRQFVISSATEHILENCEEPDEPPPDYDTDSEAGNNARNSAASSSSLSQGDDASWSDPCLGFSTWRR